MTMNYIKGTYIKEIFSNATNGYVVGIIKVIESDVKDIDINVYFVGNFIDLRIKSNYIMKGEFITHPKYGKQFSVSSYEVAIPTKKEEIITFLSCDMFPIGEKTAQKIVDVFGEKTIETILDNKDNLLLIPRLSKEKIDKIYDVLCNYQYTSKTVMDLTSLGFSSKEALNIVSKYQNKTMDKITDNIYFLIDELDMNFKEIDEIALNNMGVDELDERRLLALTIYVMKSLCFENGDTYLFFDEIYNNILKYNHTISAEKLEYIFMKLNKDRKIVIVEDRYYLKHFYEAETYIADKLSFLNDITNRKLPKLEQKIEDLEKLNNIVYDDVQKSAIKKAINDNVVIITGGPGTGKTTIIKAIVRLYQELFKAHQDEIALLAPTGRAAKRMMETTGIKSSTIHKYLGWDKDANKFSTNEYNPNPERYIIVDEVSMLDTLVFSALLKGIKRDVKVVLVGDYYQLPSVAEGQVLKDLIDSEVIDVIHLNCLYRQNEGSYITTLAHEIKDKELSESFLTKKDDYNFVECDKELVTPTIINIITKAIKKGYSEKEIQVLAPMYKTLNGIDNLNKHLQRLFNPPSPKKNELTVGDVIYRTGDKILQLVNDNDNNVYNGDQGYITDIISHTKSASKKNEIIVDYDGNKVTYTPDKFLNIRHAYAISIHKAQGSEFPMVIMPIVNNFNRMLYNKLIYTAITRAKSSLILVGDRMCFVNGVRNDYVEGRKTTLKDFLQAKYN